MCWRFACFYAICFICVSVYSLRIIRNFASLFASSYLFDIIFTAPCSFSIPLNPLNSNSFPSFIIFFIHSTPAGSCFLLLSRSSFLYSLTFRFVHSRKEEGGSRVSPLYNSFEVTVRHSFHVCYRYISQWVLVYVQCSMFVHVFFVPFHCYSPVRNAIHSARSEYYTEKYSGHC